MNHIGQYLTAAISIHIAVPSTVFGFKELQATQLVLLTVAWLIVLEGMLIVSRKLLGLLLETIFQTAEPFERSIRVTVKLNRPNRRISR